MQQRTGLFILNEHSDFLLFFRLNIVVGAVGVKLYVRKQKRSL